jgi:CRP-like cAMP-binding protein
MKFLEENLIEHLQRPEFSQLREAFVTRSYPRNSFVCQPDSEENSIFIVSKGRVRVYLGYEDKEFNLAILAPGDIYSTHTGVYAQAMDEVELLATGVTAFRRQMASDGEVNRAMIKVLGNILKSSFAIIDGLVFKDVACRLLGFLLAEAKRQKPDNGEAVVLHINLSVEQLAGVVGSSRQTVSTQLNRLIRDGVIQRQGRGSFVIADLATLEKHCQAAGCL